MNDCRVGTIEYAYVCQHPLTRDDLTERLLAHQERLNAIHAGQSVRNGAPFRHFWRFHPWRREPATRELAALQHELFEYKRMYAELARQTLARGPDAEH